MFEHDDRQGSRLRSAEPTRARALCLTVSLLCAGAWTGRAAIVEGCGQTAVPVDCRKSVTVIKTGPSPLVVTVPRVPIVVRLNTLSGPEPLRACPRPATVLGGTVTVRLICRPPAPAAARTFMATVPIPPRGSGPQTGLIGVSVPIDPPPLPPRTLCFVTALAIVNWSEDSSNPAVDQMQTGDTNVCFVDESPDIAGEPRLDMRVADATPECPRGVQTITDVTLINNDLSNSVALRLSSDAAQRGRLPESANGALDGTYSVSSPSTGDDFPIAFDTDLPASGILPMPADPASYNQRAIQQDVTIPKGGNLTVRVVSNSWTMCADGSCAEFGMIAEGEFDDGDPVLACVSWTVSLRAGSSCPSAATEVACCLGDGSCRESLPSDCVRDGGTPGDGNSACQGDNLPANGTDDACEANEEDRVFPVQACCFHNRPCRDLDPRTCSADGGTPQGPGASCATARCPEIGACCFDDGTCEPESAPVCAAKGGEHHGGGTPCAAVDCTPAGPTGACCFAADSQCEVQTPARCRDRRGRYHGDGSTCRGDDDGDGFDDTCAPSAVPMPATSATGRLASIVLLALLTGLVLWRSHADRSRRCAR